MNLRTYWFAIALLIVAGAEGGACAQELSAESFAKMTQGAQIARLKGALLTFRDRTNKLSAKAWQVTKRIEFDPNAKPMGEKVLDPGKRMDFDFRRIGDSYLVTRTDTYLDPETAKKQPPTTATESYDERTKTRKHFGPDPAKPGATEIEGTIDSDRSDGLHCFVYQYLSNGFDAVSDPIAWFLDNVQLAEVERLEVEHGTIRVGFPCPPEKGYGIGACHVTFDLTKCGIPVLWEIETHDEDDKVVYSYKYRVLETTEVDGVWMPSKLEVYVWFPQLTGASMIFHEGGISDIEIGKLTMDDLQLSFPEGITVNDRVAMKRYKVGAGGRQIAIESTD